MSVKRYCKPTLASTLAQSLPSNMSFMFRLPCYWLRLIGLSRQQPGPRAPFINMKTRIRILVLSLLLGICSVAPARAMTAAEAGMIDSAAQHGSASAQVLLAVIYLNGLAEYAKDEAKAALWFERAAEQGNDYAQKMLADLYEEGRGVPQNAQLAADWREKAAKRGNVQAQFYWGKCIWTGPGSSPILGAAPTG